MGPDLRQDRFGAGLLRGTEAVAGLIADEYGVTLERRGTVVAPPLAVTPTSPPGSLGIVLLILFLALMSAIASRHRRNRWGD